MLIILSMYENDQKSQETKQKEKIVFD